MTRVKWLGMFVVGVLLLAGCKMGSSPSPESVLSSYEVLETNRGDIPVIDFTQLETYLEAHEGKPLVVNFWATWCKPCVEELPYFEKLQETYAKDGVQVILVSLDFPNKAEELLKPFVEKHRLVSDVVLLDDPKQNEWIPQIDPQWSGAIPATLLVGGKSRVFYEKSFTFKELEDAVLTFANR